MRRNHPPRCPSSFRGGRRALPAGTQEGPRPGGSGAREPSAHPACAARAVRPAPRRGPGALRLSGAGPGSPRGDGAPERALFGAFATLRTSFQPPPQASPPRPCLFFQPRSLHPTRKQPSGLRQRLEAVAQGRPKSSWGQRGEFWPLRKHNEGRGGSGAFREREGQAATGQGRWPDGRMTSAGCESPILGLRRARTVCAGPIPEGTRRTP